MSETLGKITTKKVPASQAIPGNAEHAKLIKKHGSGVKNKKAGWAGSTKVGWMGPALIGLLVLVLFALAFGLWVANVPPVGAAPVQASPPPVARACGPSPPQTPCKTID